MGDVGTDNVGMSGDVFFLMKCVFCGTLQRVSMFRRNEDEQSYFDR